jgi:hypothetical protein
MSDWRAPIDWVTGQKLRARNLNNEIRDNMGWLKNRPIDIKTVWVTAADLSLTNTSAWATLGPTHQLELLLPDTCNVLLIAQMNLLAVGANHQIWWDWVRDGNYYLSSPGGITPATADDGMSELLGHTTTPENFVSYWWDEEVAAGRHTWDIAINQASNTLNIQQTTNPWQLTAVAW